MCDDSYKMMTDAASSSRSQRAEKYDNLNARLNMDANTELLPEIRALEEALHRHEIRHSRKAVEALLADDFIEFGSSGAVYHRQQIIDLLAQEEGGDEGALLAHDYALRMLADDTVLLTYRTQRTTPDGIERHVLRSSIWQRTDAGWKMLFHQGTVVA